MNCPKCSSGRCHYDGAYIVCRDCGFIEWAKVVDGKLEAIYERWV